MDPISAVQQLDSAVYLGNVRRTLLQIHALIPVPFPTLTAKADKEQMCLLHLRKLLPHSFKHEFIKAGITTLELAVTTVEGMERANRVMGEQTGLNRVVTQPDAPVKLEYEDKTSPCFVCGLSDHWRVMCPFRQDICGRCEKIGHLSVMCRGIGVNSSQGNSSWSAKGQGQARERGTAPPAAQQRRQQHLQWSQHLQQQQQQQQPELHHQQWPLQQLPPEQLMGHPMPVGCQLSLHQPNSSTSELSNVSTRPECRHSCAEPGGDSSCRYRGRHNHCAPGPSPSRHTHSASW